MLPEKVQQFFKNALDKLRSALGKFSPKTVEAVATAGAVVLLVIACGFALSRTDEQQQPPQPSLNTSPTTESTGAPTETTTPTTPDVLNASDLASDTLWPLVCEEADSEYQRQNTTVEQITIQYEPHYRITLQHSGYEYQFVLNSYTGECVNLTFPANDSIKEGYLAQPAVVKKAQMMLEAENMTVEVFLHESNNTHFYRVLFVDPATKTGFSRDVNALTGEIMENLQKLSSETAISLLLMQMSIDQSTESCQAMLMSYGGSTYYVITTTEPALASTYYYVDAYTGGLRDVPGLDQIAKYTALFSDYSSWYNKALTSLYDTPADLNVRQLFHSGFPDESQKLSDEEITALQKLGVETNLTVHRLPVDKMNQVLTAYFGITLDDTAPLESWLFPYLESTDCYYLSVGDINIVEGFQATQINESSDGTIEVFYTIGEEDIIYKVRLLPNGDGYQILSNTTHLFGEKAILDRMIPNSWSHEVYDITCEYDDSNAEDLRYNITFKYRKYLYIYSVNATTGEVAYSRHTPQNPEDLIVPNENDIEIVGTTEDGLPIIDNISVNDSSGGFYWDRDGSTAISIHNGQPEFLVIQKETVTLTHNGKEHTLVFNWCANAGEIGVYRVAYGSSPDVWVYSKLGNDQYVMLIVSGDYQSKYTYLFDLNTKEIIDPLQGVDTLIWAKLAVLPFLLT